MVEKADDCTVCRAFIKSHNLSHPLRPSMLDWALLLWVKLAVFDRIHPQSNKFALGLCVKNKATSDSKPNGSPGMDERKDSG